jgi:hypothetical protein
MKRELVQQAMQQALAPTLGDVEKTLRDVLRHEKPAVVESKVGHLYGMAFRAAEARYEARGGRMP